MKIHFHGAARTVTGSQHLLSVNGKKLLLDCGLFQGRRQDMIRRNTHFAFSPADLDAVVLSHAHIDHSGNLPNLVKQGFRGPVHATHATCDLSKYMLLDSAKIQESDAAYWSRRNAHRGEAPVEPLYTSEDAADTLDSFVGHDYGQPFEVTPGVQATFTHAGHILGAAVTKLEIDEGGRRIRLVFTGDLGRSGIPLLRNPQPVSGIDYLIMESTYGKRRHEPPEQAYQKLRQIVGGCCDQKGKLIIPSFAVGRAQDLVYNLHRMMDEGELERMPIYVDSPLAVKTTQVFRRHRELFNQQARSFMHDDEHEGALFFPDLTYVTGVEKSKQINRMPGPMIVISPSGMAHAGRILHHLRNNIEDPKNTVLMVSWAAPHTLGRQLIDKKPKIKIFGDEFRVRARVEVISGFSGHADRQELLNYAAAVKEELKGVFLVHGEEASAFALKDGLQELGIDTVNVPVRGQSFTI